MSKPPKLNAADLGNLCSTDTGEHRTLGQLEAVISQAEFAFAYCGFALAKIRDEKLYLEPGYKTFEAYCRSRWGFSRQRAYQLIDAAKLAAHLTTLVDIASPENESQIRPLVGLSLDEAVEIWLLANEMAAGAPVTGSLVKKAIKSLMGDVPKPLKQIRDLIDGLHRSCLLLAEYLGNTGLESLDPRDKSRLALAVQAVVQLGERAGCMARPEAECQRRASAQIEIMRALIDPQRQSLATFRVNPQYKKIKGSARQQPEPTQT